MEQVLIISLIVLWAFVMLNFLLTLALIRRDGHSAPRTMQSHLDTDLQVGQPAPDFTAQNLQGDQVTLHGYAGQQVAFLFISPTCGPCLQALPMYEALGPAARNAGVELVLVSTADVERTRTLVNDLQLRLPILATPLGSNILGDDFGFHGTPSFCLVDAQGKVRASGYPSFDWGHWKRLADSWTSKASQSQDLALSA